MVEPSVFSNIIVITMMGRSFDSPEIIRERFNNKVQDYTAEVVSTIPNFKTGLNQISEFLEEKFVASPRVRILDLGTGIGSVAQRIAQDYKGHKIEFTLIDFAEKMLEHAVAVMDEYHQIVKPFCIDFRDFDYPQSHFDAVVSSLALHHLRPGEKPKIYPKILESLKHGGLFLNFDMLKEPDPVWEKIERERWQRYIRSIGWSKNEIDLMFAEVFEKEDSPETLVSEIETLLKSGFGSVSLISKYYLFGLIAGRKK